MIDVSKLAVSVRSIEGRVLNLRVEATGDRSCTIYATGADEEHEYEERSIHGISAGQTDSEYQYKDLIYKVIKNILDDFWYASDLYLKKIFGE